MENDNGIKIEARAFPLKERMGNLLGFATITLSDCFVVEGLKILESKEGNTFVAMPQTKDKQGWRDVCFPVTSDFHRAIVDAVLDAFAQDKEVS